MRPRPRAGKVHVTVAIDDTHNSHNSKAPDADQHVEVGILGPGELFGTVELLMSRLGCELPLPPRRRRAAVRSPFALVLACPGHIAKRLLLADKSTHAMLQKHVRHQLLWEETCKKLTGTSGSGAVATRLTVQMMTMAKYLFRPEYVLPSADLALMQQTRRDHTMLDHELHTLIARAEKYEHAGRTAQADAILTKVSRLDAKLQHVPMLELPTSKISDVGAADTHRLADQISARLELDDNGSSETRMYPPISMPEQVRRCGGERPHVRIGANDDIEIGEDTTKGGLLGSPDAPMPRRWHRPNSTLEHKDGQANAPREALSDGRNDIDATAEGPAAVARQRPWSAVEARQRLRSRSGSAEREARAAAAREVHGGKSARGDGPSARRECSRAQTLPFDDDDDSAEDGEEARRMANVLLFGVRLLPTAQDAAGGDRHDDLHHSNERGHRHHGRRHSGDSHRRHRIHEPCLSSDESGAVDTHRLADQLSARLELDDNGSSETRMYPPISMPEQVRRCGGERPHVRIGANDDIEIGEDTTKGGLLGSPDAPMPRRWHRPNSTLEHKDGQANAPREALSDGRNDIDATAEGPAAVARQRPWSAVEARQRLRSRSGSAEREARAAAAREVHGGKSARGDGPSARRECSRAQTLPFDDDDDSAEDGEEARRMANVLLFGVRLLPTAQDAAGGDRHDDLHHSNERGHRHHGRRHSGDSHRRHSIHEPCLSSEEDGEGDGRWNPRSIDAMVDCAVGITSAASEATTAVASGDHAAPAATPSLPAQAHGTSTRGSPKGSSDGSSSATPSSASRSHSARLPSVEGASSRSRRVSAPAPSPLVSTGGGRQRRSRSRSEESTIAASSRLDAALGL